MMDSGRVQGSAAPRVLGASALAVLALCGALAAPQAASAASDEGWQRDWRGWQYQLQDGSHAASAWQRVDGQWYRFGEDGYMLTGWQLLDGARYYFEPSGATVTDRWVGDRYVGADGAWDPAKQPAQSGDPDGPADSDNPGGENPDNPDNPGGGDEPAEPPVVPSEDELEYTVSDDSASGSEGATITGYTGTAKSIALPATVGSKPVTGLQCMGDGSLGGLESIDISNCRDTLEIVSIWDQDSAATKFDFSDCPRLRDVTCESGVPFSVDVSGCESLERFCCAAPRFSRWMFPAARI